MKRHILYAIKTIYTGVAEVRRHLAAMTGIETKKLKFVKTQRKSHLIKILQTRSTHNSSTTAAHPAERRPYTEKDRIFYDAGRLGRDRQFPYQPRRTMLHSSNRLYNHSPPLNTQVHHFSLTGSGMSAILKSAN